MTRQSKRELLKAIYPRYLRANSEAKSLILDEFVAVTGYHRKYAISLLRKGPSKKSTRKNGRRLICGPDVVTALVTIWQACGRPCGKRLKPFIPEMLEVLERHDELCLPPEIKSSLKQMGSATIDRRLRCARSQVGRARRSTTRPGTFLKHAIPIRAFADWDEQRPGFVEMDLVAHCGASTAGGST